VPASTGWSRPAGDVSRIKGLQVENPPVEANLEYAAMGRQLVLVSEIELRPGTVTCVLVTWAGRAIRRPIVRAAARCQRGNC
jgi:hypothetical protein